MSELEQNAGMSAVKRALIEVRQLRERIAELQGRASEPLAIVGMSVRAPGNVVDLEGFAQLLWSATDAISEIPADRWPVDEWFDDAQDVPGRMYVRHGGFLADVAGFDAEFFGIAPAEAASMDPQQRLLLELAWEAIEHAGHAPASMTGSRTGVYVGIANNDYGRSLFSRPDLIDPYFSSGNAYSVAAGRIAYVLGLAGPAVAVDTACSSSLVALHLAGQALRNGDCDAALVGGINLILSPEVNVNFCKAGMLSRDGRCRTFDAAADGYARGEGGGMLLLRRLREAVADGDRILAVVRGSAINQDGRSNGLTAPNGPAQQAVMRAALDAAGVPARAIGYVEAHGTGTSLGDPIEVGALAAVMSEGRTPQAPLTIGSVKTNVGHLEAAAGIVGVIKTVLALDRREIPAHLHLRTPNPLIDWTHAPIAVATTTTAWAPIDGRWLAGVSSFGFSGTNAHVVLEAAPEAGNDTGPDGRRTQVLAVSARTNAALREASTRAMRLLETAPEDAAWLRDVCVTANTGRTHFAHRVSVAGDTATAMAASLRRWLNGDAAVPVVAGASTVAGAPRVAFLFPGQGVQYAGMGRELYEQAPVFRAALDACAAALEPHIGRPLLPALLAEGADAAAALDRPELAQPALFAFEVALARLWWSWGIVPAAVLGHSFGEYAAAHIAGVLSLADAARIVAARARLTSTAPGDGAMVVLEASADEVLPAVAGERVVAVAAVNGPRNTVISGERGAVERIAAAFIAGGRRATTLRVGHGFHSPLMDPVLDAFDAAIDGIACAEPTTRLVSSLTGDVAERRTLADQSYWRRHLRETVRFAPAMRTLAAQGVTHYVEVGPHPVLLGMAAECVESGTWLPSLRRALPAWDDLLRSLQTLYADGATIDWRGVEAGQRARRVALPTYPFQRRRHWIDVTQAPAPSADLWPSVSAALAREAGRGPLDLNPTSYAEKWRILARLTEAQTLATLRQLGAFVAVGERETVDSLLARTGVQLTHRRLMTRWLDRLTTAGVLQHDAGGYAIRDPEAVAALPTLWREADTAFSDNREFYDYLCNCVAHLPGILTGAESPLESLFPGGSFDLASALYERSATMRYVNGLAAAALQAIVGATPPAHRLRVLEVGAGTGGTTASLLPQLPAARGHYVFTDVSEAFFGNARQRFGADDHVTFATLDLTRDLDAQGYPAGSVDVVIASNSVHAVRNLAEALVQLRRLLAPGGALILVESTADLAHFDITTGLIEGWQHFDDGLRQDTPLLSAERWIAALREAGMAHAAAWPADATTAALGQHVIVAATPGRLARRGAEPGVAITDTGTPAATPAAAPGIRVALAAALQSDRLTIVRDLVRAEVMRILHLTEDAAPGRLDRLMDLGMDSLMAVQLRNSLARACAIERLPSTLMFDHPTIEALSIYLLERLLGTAETQAPAATPAAHAHTGRGPAPLDTQAVAAMSDEEIELLLLERLKQS